MNFLAPESGAMGDSISGTGDLDQYQLAYRCFVIYAEFSDCCAEDAFTYIKFAKHSFDIATGQSLLVRSRHS